MTTNSIIISLAGGALIGIGVSVLRLFNGRVAGVVGIVSGLLRPSPDEWGWKAAFVLGPLARRLAALLIGGSALFGAGWGLAGSCPGPVVPSLPAGALPTATFAGAMVVGFIRYNRFEPAAARPNASRSPAPSQAAAKESLW
jgi:uncharacterized membrane protein YedE/YeeE